jgi:hypothetical protein
MELALPVLAPVVVRTTVECVTLPELNNAKFSALRWLRLLLLLLILEFSRMAPYHHHSLIFPAREVLSARLVLGVLMECVIFSQGISIHQHPQIVADGG